MVSPLEVAHKLKIDPKKVSSVWRLFEKIAVILTLMTFIGTIYSYNSHDDYELSIFLAEEKQLLSLGSYADELRITIDSVHIPSLYLNTFVIKNTGTKPISSEEVIQSLVMVPNSGRKLYKAISESNVASVKLLENNVLVNFDLLNSGESIYISVFSDEAITFSYQFRIKGVGEVQETALKDFKPLYDRLYSVHWFFYLTLVLSVIAYVDSRLVLQADKHFKKVLNFIKFTRKCKTLKVDVFLDELENKYTEYYNNAKCILMEPSSVIEIIKSRISNEKGVTPEQVANVCYHANTIIRHGNGYDTRGNFLNFIPLFIITVIGFAYGLIPWGLIFNWLTASLIPM